MLSLSKQATYPVLTALGPLAPGQRVQDSVEAERVTQRAARLISIRWLRYAVLLSSSCYPIGARSPSFAHDRLFPT